MEPMIQVENLCKSFSTKNGTVEAARNISFSIEKGEIFGIIGLSGPKHIFRNDSDDILP